MKKTLLLCSLILVLFSAIGFAQNAAPATDSSALLYKISGNGVETPSYIYGTIHVICPSDMAGMDKLSASIAESEQVMMELDFDDASEMQGMATKLAMPDGKTLKDFLTAEQYAKVDEMFKNYTGMSADLIKSYRPMLSSIMVSASPKALGCSTMGSYDLSFMQIAVKEKKPILGLETVAEQFSFIDKKPLEEQAKELYEMAENPQKSIDQFKKMIEIYKTQNVGNLYKLIDGQLGSKEFQGVMLDQRNANWIPKIEKAVAEKMTFIAVGAGHLEGENGILNLLRKKGYKIEPIKL